MVTGISGSEFSKNWVNNIFNEVDANADGQISKGEFQDAFSKILAKKMSGKEGVGPEIDADDLFSKIDKSGDGTISKEEFTAFIDERKQTPPPPMPYGLNLLDLLMSADASDIFSEIDTDGDGKVSQAEFTDYIEKQKGAMQSEMQATSAENIADASTETIAGV